MRPVTHNCANSDLARVGQVQRYSQPFITYSYHRMYVVGVGKLSSGYPYVAWGGATDYDPTKGLLLILVEPSNVCDPNTADSIDYPIWYALPSGSGPITNMSGMGDTLTVTTAAGVSHTFSLVKGVFTS